MADSVNSTERFEPYPLYVNLAGEPVVVIGGGQVAERKVLTLLEHGACIRLIAPEATEALQGLAAEGSIEWQPRGYAPNDLEASLLAVCATDDSQVSEAVYAEAVVRHMLVNVVDVPHLCNVIVPSVLKRGRLQIAVSTGGASPSCARDIRRSLETQFPAYWEDYLDTMAELRCLVKERVPGPTETRTPLYAAIGESDLQDRFAAGEHIDAETAFQRIVAPLLEGGAR